MTVGAGQRTAAVEVEQGLLAASNGTGVASPSFPASDRTPAVLSGGAWRSADFHSARPHYPDEALRHALSGVDSDALVVDLGAGTGILTRAMKAVHGGTVLALEPANAMRLHQHDSVCQVAALAECLPIRERSIDVIVAGHAAHWFDPDRSIVELQRVLKPQGRVVWLWNRIQHQSLSLQSLWRRLGARTGHWTDDVAWREQFEASPRFDVAALPECPFERKMGVATFRRLVRSGSQFTEASAIERDEIARLTDMALEGQSTVDLRYVTVGLVARLLQ